MELLFVTTISPEAIVYGKYVAAMALTFLIYSACMPFLIFTYFLRGVDLISIFWTSVGGFLLFAVANALGVFAGAIGKNWVARGLALVALVPCFPVFYMIGVAVGLLPFGDLPFGGPPISASAQWAAFGIGVPVVLLLVGAINFFPTEMLRSRSANRLRPGSTLWLHENE